MGKRIGLDLDGVLADFTGGFWNWAIEADEECYPEPTTWRFYEQWDWTEDEFFKAHLNFVKDGGYLDLAVIGGSDTRNALQRLAAAGHTIVLITARGANMTFGEQGVLHRQTADWLKANHLPHHELHLTDKKTDVPVDWMLDDNVDNYRAMQGAGVDVFLMDQPWNEDQNDFVKNTVRVPSVTEYVDTILAEEQEQPVTWTYDGPLLKVDTDPWSDERTDLLNRFTHELSKASGDGSKKRQAGEKPPWYIDGSHEGAIFSHLTKWKRGEKVDPDSGAHPLVHLAWRALAIACQESGNTPDPMVNQSA